MGNLGLFTFEDESGFSVFQTCRVTKIPINFIKLCSTIFLYFGKIRSRCSADFDICVCPCQIFDNAVVSFGQTLQEESNLLVIKLNFLVKNISDNLIS